MPVRESKTKTYITIGIIVYVLCIYFSFHLSAALVRSVGVVDNQPTQSIQFGDYTPTQPVTEAQGSFSIGVIMDGMLTAVTEPLKAVPVDASIAYPLLFFAVMDFLIIGYMMASSQMKAQSAPGIEQGSAKWNVDYKTFREQFIAPFNPKKDPFDNNILFSRRTSLMLDNKLAQRNMNCLVIGGSGSGKSFRIIKPNIAQMNSSAVITDPSGELMRCFGKMLINQGKKVKVFSTSDMVHSNCYNPFDYIYDEYGNPDETKVSTMIYLYLKNASNAKKNSGDPFWEKSAKAFLAALVYYLIENDTMSRRNANFSTVLKLTQMGKIDEGSNSSESALDKLMEQHRKRMNEQKKDSKAIMNYDTFKLAPAKTANSILISCAVDLQLFGDEKVKNLTRTDYDDDRNNLHLEQIGDEQTYLFINIPQANETYDFLVAMLYSQMFDTLYTRAEQLCPKKWLINDAYGNAVLSMFNTEDEAKAALEAIKRGQIVESKTKRGAVYYQIKNGKKVVIERANKESIERVIKNAKHYTIEHGSERLPWHVRCLMDEFANIGEVPEFGKKLATMRKYEISCTIVLQSIAQLKEKYEKSWEGIVGNCDTIVFLGSSEYETCKYISDLLGETTIRTRNMSYSKKSGASESFSSTKRMLMTPNEVGSINKGRRQKCIVRIRDVDPFFDNKLDFRKHPNYRLTGDFKGSQKMDAAFMDIYFNSTPIEVKKSSRGKRSTQKAAAEVLGSTKYVPSESFKEMLAENGITTEEVSEKVEVQDSTPENKKHKEMVADGKEPVKTEAELRAEQVKVKRASAIMSSNETSGLADNEFFF